MTADYQPQFELLDSPPNAGSTTVAIVRDAWLPLFLWPNVSIIRHLVRQLTAVERFLLEAAIELGTFTTEDIAEITSIPRLAVHRIARRLASQRALLVLPNRQYAVQVVEAQATLERQAIIEQQRGVLTFAFLPRTDDLLVFGEGTDCGDAPRLDRIGALIRAPVSNAFVVERNSFLQRRVRERAVFGLPNEVVDVEVPQEDREIPESCPAFHASGYVEEDGGELRAFLNLYGRDARSHGNQEDDLASVSLRLVGALALTREWVALSRVMENADAQEHAWCALNANDGLHAAVPRATQVQATTWDYRINAEMADCIAKSGRPLVQPLGLAVRSDNACVSVRVMLSPSCPESARRFAVDDVVIRLQTSKDISVDGLRQMLHDAMTERGVSADIGVHVDAVRDRLWQLKHYRQIYALRRAEDMCYE